METIGLIGGFVILTIAGFFAIGAAEGVANQKGQSLFGKESSPFDKSSVKYKDGDNT